MVKNDDGEDLMVEDAQEKRGRGSHSAFTRRQHLTAGKHISLGKTKYGVIGWRVVSLSDLRGHSFATDATLTFILRDFVTLRLAETVLTEIGILLSSATGTVTRPMATPHHGLASHVCFVCSDLVRYKHSPSIKLTI